MLCRDLLILIVHAKTAKMNSKGRKSFISIIYSLRSSRDTLRTLREISVRSIVISKSTTQK
jgi:hypothetical protein